LTLDGRENKDLPTRKAAEMRLVRLVLVSLIAVLAMGSTPAAAYVDSGADPEGDSEFEALEGPGNYDISFSTRSVVQGPQRKNLRIGTRVYDPDFWLGSWVFVDVKLDARGGQQADAVLHIWILDQSGNGCQLETRSGRLLRRGTLRFVGAPVENEFGHPSYFGVNCRVPVYRLHPTKAIRWKITTVYGNGEPVFDTAPNEGMYS
jgi:hypothetical protein